MSSHSADILLVGLNARYAHTAYGLMCLRASLGPLRERSRLIEFTIKQPVDEMAGAIAGCRPRLVAIGVYIWNRSRVEALVTELRSRLPGVTMVLGGPEIAYDARSALAGVADVVIRGEGEVALRDVCEAVLAGQPVGQTVEPPLLPASVLRAPLDDYRDEDVARRVLYVETSRGCPCKCAYCLSARDTSVRLFDLDHVLPAWKRLVERGGRRFRFIDRSFNLFPDHAVRILDFILAHWCEGMRLHFEMTPRRPRSDLRERLERVPAGGLHLEIGVQTLNPDVASQVGRDRDVGRILDALRYYTDELGADVHVDLIAGLPGESLRSFKQGFDQLVALRPSELQVGILKRLHGAPLCDQASAHGLVFSEQPPYEVLKSAAISANELDSVKRFAAHWDRAANRHRFPRTLPMLLASGDSAYDAFEAYSARLAVEGGVHGAGLVEQAHAMLETLMESGLSPRSARESLRRDYLDDGRRISLPAFLR